MSDPLIPGSRVYREPLNTKLEDLSKADTLRVGAASRSYKWHWENANIGAGGYDPWHDDKPHHKQQEFHDSKVKFKAFIGGVGSGKTLAGAAEAVREAIDQPGSTGIISAPTYKMLKQATKETFRELLHPYAIARENKQDNIIELVNDSKIWFRSTDDPDKIRGIDASWFWFDEGAHTSGEAWDILIGRLREVGYNHRGWLTTTPKGFNWVYDKFAQNISESYEWVKVSSEDNPWLDEDYITSMKADYSDRLVDQEIHGGFVGFEGLVYDAFNEDQNIAKMEMVEDAGERIWKVEKGPTEEPHTVAFPEVIYAHDWGYTQPGVVLVIGVDGDERFYVLDEYFRRRQTIQERVRHLSNTIVPKYGSGMHICDPAEPDHVKTLQRSGFTAHAPDNNVLPGIEEVSSRLKLQDDGRPRLLVRDTCNLTIDEFRKYRFKDESDDVEKANDHAMDALRYAAMYKSSGDAWGTLDEEHALHDII